MNRTKLIKTIFSQFFAFFTLFFFSCEGFMDSKEFQNEIDEKLDYANSGFSTLFINAQDGTGTFIQGGGTKSLKPTDSFEVEFQVNGAYQFIRWTAVNRYDNSTRESYINFSAPDSTKTSVTLLAGCEDILIRPYCVPYLTVTDFFPAYKESGTGYNSNIKITFSDYMDESAFSFTQTEIEALAVEDNALLKDIAFDGSEFTYGYVKNGKTYFKNIEITSSNTNGSILGWFEAPKIINGKTLYLSIKKEYYLALKSTLSSSGTSEITVSLSDSILSSAGRAFAKSTSSLSFSYIINSEIIAETRSIPLYFCVDDGLGSLSMNGENTIFIGYEYPLSFKADDLYYFKNWSLCYKENGKEIPYAKKIITFDDCSSSDTTFFLTMAISGLMVKPVCVERPVVKSYEIDSSGNIRIVFSHHMSFDMFFWKDSEFPVETDSVSDIWRDSKNRIYGYKTNSGIIRWRNFTITSGNTNLLSYFELPELSNDGKTLVISKKAALPSATAFTVSIDSSVYDEDFIPLSENGTIDINLTTN